MSPHWLPKKEMTEEDIKLQFITPAIQQKWGLDSITMETKVKLTDGMISLKGNTPVREAQKKADYVLYPCTNRGCCFHFLLWPNRSVS